MKKKRVLTMIAAMAMTAVVCVGGTLAFLSQKSNTVTNAVTIGTGYAEDPDGHHGLFLDETEYQYNEDKKVNEITGDRTEDGNTYENLLPTYSFTKDPMVTMVGGSVQSYVFVKVEGVDGLEAITAPNGSGTVFDIADWNTGDGKAWLKVNTNGTVADIQEGDGYYVYQGTMATSNIVDVSLETEGSPIQLPEAIFSTLKVNDVDQMPEQATVENDAVKVTAYAVQAGVTPQGYAAALAEITE